VVGHVGRAHKSSRNRLLSCGQWEIRQRANTRDLVLGIVDLLVFASSFYTLEPGDVLFTGTPEGVGPVVPGDVIVTDFAGIGRMTVAVHGARTE